MTWATGTADAPRLHTYQEAVAHEAKVIPIRRKVPECKPLGRRDCTNLTIRKDKRSIVVSSWGVTVTYRPSGAIDVRIDYRACTSDMTLMWRLLGVQVFTHDGITWIEALDPANPDQQRTGFYPMKLNYEGPTGQKYRRRYLTATLRPVAQTPEPRNRWGRCVYTMDNIVYPKKRTIDRKGAAAVRARYKPFLTLLSGYLKMTADQEVPRDRSWPYAEPAGQYFKANKAKMQGDKHLDTQMELVQMLARNGTKGSHIRLAHGLGYKYVVRVDAAKVLATAKKMLHDAHPAEAYRTTVIKDGSIFKNRH